jgi:hypothetical protein
MLRLTFALLGLAISVAAQANVSFGAGGTFYADRAAFAAATPGATDYSFAGTLPPGSRLDLGIQYRIGDVEIRTRPDNYLMVLLAPNAPRGGGPADPARLVSSFTEGDGGYLIFGFDTPVNAFGFTAQGTNVGGGDDPRGGRLTIISNVDDDDFNVLTVDALPFDQPTFFGVTFKTPVTELFIQTQSFLSVFD